MAKPRPVPKGFRSLNVYLAVENAAEAIDFYTRAFGGKERTRLPGPDGTIGHAEIEIGDSVVMVSDPFPQASAQPPTRLGGTSMTLLLYTKDVDATVEQATEAGGTLSMPVQDMFWGDRFGQITDPFGHVWQVATHVEDVPPEEMEERAKAAMAAMAPS